MSNLSAQLIDQLTSAFQMIEKVRMDGVPILNKKLETFALGFDQDIAFMGETYLLGLVSTPWFMNLYLINQDDQKRKVPIAESGKICQVNLPGGRFEFLTGFEDLFGAYLSCSLFSPMEQFADQAGALQTAEHILQLVLDGDQEHLESEDEANERAIWEGRLPQVEIADSAGEAVNMNVDAPETTQPPQPMSRRALLFGKDQPTSSQANETGKGEGV